MNLMLPKPAKNGAAFATDQGALFVGACENVLDLPALRSLEGKVKLIFTSPPFPLNVKKAYGNLRGEAYVKWLANYAEQFTKMLTPDGSIVIEIGNAWEPGKPVQSLLPYQALLAFIEAGKLQLCQEITYHNPARLPSPAQWVTIERIRLKDATTKIWWMAKTERPDADNKRVLKPYSKAMQRLLKIQKYNSGKRPSEHEISETGFLKDNGGSIASNLVESSNTYSQLGYQKFCKDHGKRGHPARMPDSIPEFFIKFLTSEGDIVLDPFSGSNTTGNSAERLNRRWVSIEADAYYAACGVSRFDEEQALELLEKYEKSQAVG